MGDNTMKTVHQIKANYKYGGTISEAIRRTQSNELKGKALDTGSSIIDSIWRK